MSLAVVIANLHLHVLAHESPNEKGGSDPLHTYLKYKIAVLSVN